MERAVSGLRKETWLRKAPKTVLLVDDDRGILRTFTRILQRAGYEIETAENGGEAMKKMRARSFDVALIDVILGDSDGLDILREIRENFPGTIRIVITGADSYEKRTKACTNGVDVYLTKPINPAVLLSIFEEKLKNA
jgi:DNA-binding response OmpR family regulator